jgi:glycosyltransferase involved in cell wall biosynthesis
MEIQRDAYERAAACCLTSSWAARSVVDDYGIDRSKVHVVGIAGTRQPPSAASRDWTVPRFLFVGWDWHRKNGDRLLEAFAQVRKTVPRAELHLVGGHPRRIEQEGVVPHGPLRLDRPAERARVDDLFVRCTCYVMPSRVEPSAIAHVEAGMFGLPSIATSVGGSAELVGEGGVAVDPDDVHGLVDAMVSLSDPDLARSLGAKARQRAQLYTWPAVAGRILAALGLGETDQGGDLMALRVTGTVD